MVVVLLHEKRKMIKIKCDIFCSCCCCWSLYDEKKCKCAQNLLITEKGTSLLIVCFSFFFIMVQRFRRLGSSGVELLLEVPVPPFVNSVLCIRVSSCPSTPLVKRGGDWVLWIVHGKRRTLDDDGGASILKKPDTRLLEKRVSFSTRLFSTLLCSSSY